MGKSGNKSDSMKMCRDEKRKRSSEDDFICKIFSNVKCFGF